MSRRVVTTVPAIHHRSEAIIAGFEDVDAKLGFGQYC